SPTTPRSDGSPSGSPPRWDAGWTTPRPGWTSDCPTAPACTPSCPPVSGSGTCLSLRVLRRTRHSLADLASLGTLPGKSEELLRSLVARRLAFLVTGGTGSGKTTLLSALLGAADPRDRIVLCEDAAELTPAHPHVVRLVT